MMLENQCVHCIVKKSLQFQGAHGFANLILLDFKCFVFVGFVVVILVVGKYVKSIYRC